MANTNTNTNTTNNDKPKPKPSSSLPEFISPLTKPLSEPLLYNLSYHFSKTFTDLASHSTDQFFPTPITHLPTGKEQGRYLAVYVGLFYLHVGFIELLGCDNQDQQHGQEHVHERRQREYDRRMSPSVRRTLEKAWPIEERLKWEHPVEFFAWIGACIAEVVGDSLRNDAQHSELVEARELVAGISFCFPIVQKSLDEAVLLPTGKGFALSSDLNLRQALLDGYECHIRPQSPDTDSDNLQDEAAEESEEREEQTRKRRKHFSLPKLKIAAMTNDTVATFASLAYSINSSSHAMHTAMRNNSRVVMGLMVGAGCNSTVPMKVSSLHPSKTEFITRSYSTAEKAATTAAGMKTVETLVSTEWTLLRSSQPLLDLNLMTRWDRQISTESQPPGFQPMEYMVGGRYMGELVRLIVLEYFTTVLDISADTLPWQLLRKGGLTTEFLSLYVASSSATSVGHGGVQEEEEETLAKELNKRLPSAQGWAWNADKAAILRSVAFTVQSRSTAIIAAATVGLLACIGEIELKNPDNNHDNKNKGENGENDKSDKVWTHGTPEELVVAFSGGVIQNYPRYKENLQRHIDRLLVHGGPQRGGKSILLREVSDGGIIGVGVLAGSVMGGIEGIVGSKLN